ncbi:MAG: hypothetical protein PHI63_03580 [Patescibacteria group bacterium]|nr:hypothetical protein [Patescibacteria group bacterium]
MKKLIHVASVVSLLSMSVLPALAQEVSVNTNSGLVNTGFVRSAPGGEPPVIKVKWEMKSGTLGLDDSTKAGAQILPPVSYQGTVAVSYCAVATDENGLADINAVYADVYYPEGIGIHRVNAETELGTPGCGTRVGDEIKLAKMSKTDGYNLLCNSIRTNNNNLPVWGPFGEGLYNYDEVCAEDGELMKETAAVFCGSRTLYYEDPAGSYRVDVFAQDHAGNSSAILSNVLQYLPITAFETDFTSVNYGKVLLNTHQIKNGNLTFSLGDGMPTVRNIGNTRLKMTVKQDDMGLGSTDGAWNVKFDARVGSNALFAVYYPNVTKTLNNTVELSETNEMDFSIEVYKFPTAYETGQSYTGTMVLGAVAQSALVCED